MTRTEVFVIDKHVLKIETGYADKALFKPGRDVFLAYLRGETVIVRWGKFDDKSGFAGFTQKEAAQSFLNKCNSTNNNSAQTSKK